MGKLVVTEFISLDGIIEDPGGSEGSEHGGWSFRHPAPDGEQFKGDELRDSDVQLLGRVTYEGFAAAWPAMEEATGDYGKKMNAMPKVVVSTTLTEPTWNNTTIISGNVADEVARLKADQTYEATAWVRASRPGVEVQVNLFELRGGRRYAVDTIGAVPRAGEWQRLDVSHDTHRPGATLAVEILAPSLTGGTSLLVDDLAVRAIPSMSMR